MFEKQSNTESDLIFHLEKAIEKEEIELYYQPIIHTISGSLCGFEALSRWNHPQLGLLMPGAYIDVLERSRQAYRLDCYVVEKACQRYAQEREAGRPLVPLSVNLSRLDFEMVDMVAFVGYCTKKYRVPNQMLNLEVTESAFTDNENLLKDTINRFHMAGHQVWMDDFGSGYSSLNTLKDFVFDELKIDMRFLSDTSMRSRRIIAAVVSMAKNINMVTLAEGVETKEQLDFLRMIGCDRLQGYYFCEPLPYERAVKKLEEHGIYFETQEDRRYYHDINRINLLSPAPFLISDGAHETHGGGIPLSIVEYENNKAKFLYTNEEFQNDMHVLGAVDAEDMLQKLVRFGILSSDALARFIRNIIVNGTDKVDFSVNGDYCSAKGKCISESGERHALLLSVTNITRSMDIDHEQLLNQSMRNIYSMYLRVSVLRVGKNEVTPVFEHTRTDIEVDKTYQMDVLIKHYSENIVHPDDRQKYMDFLHPGTLEQRILNSRNGFINTKIRSLDSNGEYTTKMYLALAMGNQEIMLLVRHANL